MEHRSDNGDGGTIGGYSILTDYDAKGLESYFQPAIGDNLYLYSDSTQF
jgi:hypothetical protein